MEVPMAWKKAMKWIEENRCPYCANAKRCKKDYAVRKTKEGWQCHGYFSKYLDERRWEV